MTTERTPRTCNRCRSIGFVTPRPGVCTACRFASMSDAELLADITDSEIVELLAARARAKTEVDRCLALLERAEEAWAGCELRVRSWCADTRDSLVSDAVSEAEK